MSKKYLIGFLLLFTSWCYSQNPVENFFEAHNKRDWPRFKNLLHKDFKCIVDSGKVPASREQFYLNMYADDVWSFTEWKILSMEETSTDCYLVKGTFTDEYDMWLYGAPVEGVWTYCCKDDKIISLDWLDFPDNPNQRIGDQKDKAFNDWITLNYPDYTGISVYWSHDAALIFRDLFRLYRKGRN